jgi:hypothetical protein
MKHGLEKTVRVHGLTGPAHKDRIAVISRDQTALSKLSGESTYRRRYDI